MFALRQIRREYFYAALDVLLPDNSRKYARTVEVSVRGIEMRTANAVIVRVDFED